MVDHAEPKIKTFTYPERNGESITQEIQLTFHPLVDESGLAARRPRAEKALGFGEEFVSRELMSKYCYRRVLEWMRVGQKRKLGDICIRVRVLKAVNRVDAVAAGGPFDAA